MSLLALYGHGRHLFLVLFPLDGTHHLEYRRHNQHHTPTSHNYFLVDTVAAVDNLAVPWEFCPETDCDPSRDRGCEAILSVQDYAIDFCCDVLLYPQYLALPGFYDAVDGDGEIQRRRLSGDADDPVVGVFERVRLREEIAEMARDARIVGVADDVGLVAVAAGA